MVVCLCWPWLGGRGHHRHREKSPLGYRTLRTAVSMVTAMRRSHRPEVPVSCPMVGWAGETYLGDSQGKPIMCLIPNPLPPFRSHGLPLSLRDGIVLYSLQNHNIWFDLSELCTNHVCVLKKKKTLKFIRLITYLCCRIWNKWASKFYFLFSIVSLSFKVLVGLILSESGNRCNLSCWCLY